MLPDALEKKSTQVLNDTAPAVPQLARHGFEIVDKRSGKEVYLDGSWAEMFQEQILAWQRETPTQEEAVSYTHLDVYKRQRLAFDVSGQAKKFAYSARAELLWQHDGNRYEARQEISAFLVGTRMQRSVGTVTEQGLLPEKFSDKSRSEQAAHFDYAKGRVTFSANTPEAAAGPGVQDRLSLFIQLGAMLAADPGRFVPGTQITLTTVSARSADRWTFTCLLYTSRCV